jgi:hypothetical protein
MGYRNPRNYFIQDPTAGARAFEKSFKETFTQIDDYYTGLKQTAQKKNIELATESQKLQDEINKMEKLGSNAKEGIRQMVAAKMNELKSSIKTEEGGIFTRAFTAKVSGPTPQQMNEAINGVKDFSSDLNKTLDMAYKFDENKVDNGGKNFKYVKAMMSHLKENPDAIEYNYKDGKFDFELKFNHPIYGDQVLNRSVVASMINEVDGSSVNRSSLDEMYKGRISALEGQIKSHVSEREKELRANNKTGLASGIDYATQRVSNEVENMEDDRIESFYFNHSRVNKPEQQWEAFRNLDNAVAKNASDQIESKPDYLKPKINAALMNLLNNPSSDIATFEREFDRLGLVGINKEDLSEAILDYRMDVVKESMIQDVVSKGVISGVNVRRDRKVLSKATSRSRGRSGTAKEPKIDQGSADAVSKLWGAIGDKKSLGFQGGYIDPGKVKTNSGTKDIANTEYDASTNTLTVEWPSGKNFDKKQYSLNSPKQMRALYKDFAFTTFDDKGWTKSTIESIENQGYSALNKENMNEWVDWIEENGNINDVQSMKEFVVETILPQGLSSPIMQTTWKAFYEKNRSEINAMYRESL